MQLLLKLMKHLLNKYSSIHNMKRGNPLDYPFFVPYIFAYPKIYVWLPKDISLNLERYIFGLKMM